MYVSAKAPDSKKESDESISDNIKQIRINEITNLFKLYVRM